MFRDGAEDKSPMKYIEKVWKRSRRRIQRELCQGESSIHGQTLKEKFKMKTKLKYWIWQ